MTEIFKNIFRKKALLTASLVPLLCLLAPPLGAEQERNNYFKQEHQPLYRSITRPPSGVVQGEKKTLVSDSLERLQRGQSTRKVPPLLHEKSQTKRKTTRPRKMRKALAPKKKKVSRRKARKVRKSRNARKSRKVSRKWKRTNRKRSRLKKARKVRRSRAPGYKLASSRKSTRRKRARKIVNPTTINPTPRQAFRYRTPEFYRGIYVTNSTARNKRLYKRLLTRAKSAGINTLVVDVQPRVPGKEFIRYTRESGFYLVSRVVFFHGGLKKYPAPQRNLNKVLGLAEKSARNGFMEVQFDYIRFADHEKGKRYMRLSLKKRYAQIEKILKMGTERLRPLGVRIGADIFGRIPFNRRDIIGQNVELFSTHLDTLYPMLYPSHFYGEPHMINDPYKTILLGSKKCMRRSEPHTKTIAYIQGFKYKYRGSGLSFVNYIRKQIKASEDAGSKGYIIWNARNVYGASFTAMKLHRKYKAKKAAKKKLAQNSPQDR